MLPTSEQVRALATRCEQFRDAKAPGGYPNSLALCIVDSVQSTGIRYGATAKVVNRYRAYRTAQGGDPETDSVSDLVQTFTELATPEAWAAKIGTDNRTSTHAGARSRHVRSTRPLRQWLEARSKLARIYEMQRRIMFNWEVSREIGALYPGSVPA